VTGGVTVAKRFPLVVNSKELSLYAEVSGYRHRLSPQILVSSGEEPLAATRVYSLYLALSVSARLRFRSVRARTTNGVCRLSVLRRFVFTSLYDKVKTIGFAAMRHRLSPQLNSSGESVP